MKIVKAVKNLFNFDLIIKFTKVVLVGYILAALLAITLSYLGNNVASFALGLVGLLLTIGAILYSGSIKQDSDIVEFLFFGFSELLGIVLVFLSFNFGMFVYFLQIQIP